MSYELKIYNQEILDIHKVLTYCKLRNKKKLYKKLRNLCNNKYILQKSLFKLKPILENNHMFLSLPDEVLNSILFMAAC